jgi:hypothetical protein
MGKALVYLRSVCKPEYKHVFGRVSFQDTAVVNSEKSQYDVKSHQKLVHRGHVAEESELPKAPSGQSR